jgi:hypothetical protein
MLRTVVVLCLAAIPVLAGVGQPPSVPEPSTIVLVGGGLLAAALIARSRHSRK